MPANRITNRSIKHGYIFLWRILIIFNQKTYKK